MRKHIAVLLAVAVAASLAAVAQASPAAPRASSATIVGIASGNKNFSTLVTLVKKAGLVNTLNSKGPFTVFAPTNQAFTNLKKNDPTLYKQVTTNKKTLQTVLTYHVIGQRIPAMTAISAAKAKTMLKTAQGEKIATSFSNGRIVLNASARVTLPDVKASNGIIHAINAVIVPPSIAKKTTIVGIASGNKNFSTLVTLVKKAGLVNTLNSKGPFTVFAPTNQAFTNLKKNDPTLYKQVTTNKKTLQTVLTYHVIGQRIPAMTAISAAKAKTMLKTAQGEKIATSFSNGRIVLNASARVTLPDVKASNGIIHAINAVIVPPSIAKKTTIVGIASGNKNFSTLVTLVKKAGLVNTLNSKGPFTVFAPTNQAFTNLEATAPETFEAVTSDPKLLAKVLTYHVVSGAILSKQAIGVAQENGSVTAVAKEPIALSLLNGKLTLNGSSTVTTADVRASNGVIHAIDAVIVPPSLSS